LDHVLIDRSYPGDETFVRAHHTREIAVLLSYNLVMISRTS